MKIGRKTARSKQKITTTAKLISTDMQSTCSNLYSKQYTPVSLHSDIGRKLTSIVLKSCQKSFLSHALFTFHQYQSQKSLPSQQEQNRVRRHYSVTSTKIKSEVITHSEAPKSRQQSILSHVGSLVPKSRQQSILSHVRSLVPKSRQQSILSHVPLTGTKIES